MNFICECNMHYYSKRMTIFLLFWRRFCYISKLACYNFSIIVESIVASSSIDVTTDFVSSLILLITLFLHLLLLLLSLLSLLSSLICFSLCCHFSKFLFFNFYCIACVLPDHGEWIIGGNIGRLVPKGQGTQDAWW